MKVIELNGVAFTCTLSERFRRHTAEELDAMRESVRSLGILVPVRVYHDITTDTPNCVLDGEGRLTVAAELGANVPFQDEGRLSTHEAYEQAKAFNDARRQDDPEAVRQRRVEKVAELRAEGKSIRAIAEETGVSKSQVERDLELSPPGTVEPGRVTGKDGKVRPARRATPDDEPDDDEPSPLEAALAAIASQDAPAEAIAKAAEALARQIEEFAATPAGAALCHPANGTDGKAWCEDVTEEHLHIWRTVDAAPLPDTLENRAQRRADKRRVKLERAAGIDLDPPGHAMRRARCGWLRSLVAYLRGGEGVTP